MSQPRYVVIHQATGPYVLCRLCANDESCYMPVGEFSNKFEAFRFCRLANGEAES